MSKRVPKPPKVRQDEVILDSDSESEHEEFQESSDDYIPSESSGNESERPEDVAFEFESFEPQPSTSRATVNIRGGSRRGRGRGQSSRSTRRGVQQLERQQSDILWTEEGVGELPHTPEFTGTPGIQVDIEPGASPWEYFNLFVPDELIVEMVEQTNLYAAQYKEALGAAIKPHNLLADWKDITSQELKVFLALLFIMGIVDKPDIKSYWSTNPIIASVTRDSVLGSVLSATTQMWPSKNPGWRREKTIKNKSDS